MGLVPITHRALGRADHNVDITSPVNRIAVGYSGVSGRFTLLRSGY
jgi:hypothetical protein